MNSLLQFESGGVRLRQNVLSMTRRDIEGDAVYSIEGNYIKGVIFAKKEDILKVVEKQWKSSCNKRQEDGESHDRLLPEKTCHIKD